MAVRSTMAALIARLRLLLNDPASASQLFSDQDIQDVMDESRMDIANVALTAKPTFSGSTIQYLDYYSDLGSWEDDTVFKQYLTVPVTPSTLEPIAGHWKFATTTLPPVYLTGKTYDIYRAAADLLERQAAKWTLSYDFTSDSQSFRRSQAADALQKLAHTYRLKQRAYSISAVRSDMNNQSMAQVIGLGPVEIDYMSSGS